MKYIKGTFAGSIDYDTDKATILGKQRLTMPDGFSENLWVGKRTENPDTVVLLNDALIFMPFHSWGAIIGKGQNDMSELRKKEVIELHPEAFDAYLKQGVINEQGEIINDPNFTIKLEAYRNA